MIYARDISGVIPNELFVLKELVDLNLGQNILSGPITPVIGQLSKMQYLGLGINNLSSYVPPELGNLTKLISLYIDSSGVSGEFPQEMAKLKSLKTLWASDINSLERRLGDLTHGDSTLTFLENLTSLSILSLRNNRITGQIPGKLAEFPNLKYLDLSFNKLTGQIPSSFQDFKSLEMLYLGNNNLNGELPSNIVTPSVAALDVSFNSFSGNILLNYAKSGLSMNLAGTSIDANSLYDKKVVGMLHCLQKGSACSNKAPAYSSFPINCGGRDQISNSGVPSDGDSKTLESASLYTNPDGHFALSNIGIFINNPNGSQYTVNVDNPPLGALLWELFKTARISPSSLRYYGFGLENGKYNVDLYFSDIGIDDSTSWRGLRQRLFDVYIQGERVLQDFSIKDEAGGSKRPIIRSFEANVTNTILEIHFFWAGKGTCCIPAQGTYGPLVSAISAYKVASFLAKEDKKQ